MSLGPDEERIERKRWLKALGVGDEVALTTDTGSSFPGYVLRKVVRVQRYGIVITGSGNIGEHWNSFDSDSGSERGTRVWSFRADICPITPEIRTDWFRQYDLRAVMAIDWKKQSAEVLDAVAKLVANSAREEKMPESKP